MPPKGIFGIPHGILSSVDEKVAFSIGIVAPIAAVFYDGDFDIRPVSLAAIVGILISLLGSFAAPQAITNEWHILVLVVLLVVASIVIARRRE